MASDKTIYLVDGNVRRRAAIYRVLSSFEIHVEPFENTQELSAYGPRDGVVFLADNSSDIENLLHGFGLRDCWLPIICFSEDPLLHQVVQAVLDGATGYVRWPCSEAGVLAAIASADQNQKVAATVRLRGIRAWGRLATLTSREREVLDGITDGLSNREMGERLCISPRTVEIHRSNMLRKVGARHTADAIRIAVEASPI
ncbi:MAG: DNA-binding response regulator [Novosphingobium sp.]|nr:DNA-binding response regulator [Novosphingobium sp.]